MYLLNYGCCTIPINITLELLHAENNMSCMFVFSHLCSCKPEVPPNAELSLEVKLLEATDAPDLELLSPADRITLAVQKRQIGNVYYDRGDYASAVNSYSIALQITESSSKSEIMVRNCILCIHLNKS